MKTPLPEKITPPTITTTRPLGSVETGTLSYPGYLSIQDKTINQLIDHVKELGEIIDQKKWDRDNEYARGFNDGAFAQNMLNETSALKEQLLNGLFARQYPDMDNLIYAMSPEDAQTFINKLLP